MSKHASPAVIGGFTLTACALLLAGIFVLGGARYFHDTAHVIVYFEGSVAGLRVGAPVKFRGIEIGTVKEMRISMSGAVRDPTRIRIPVLLEIDEDSLRAQGIPKTDLDDRAQLDILVAQGLRAELATESFVTGVLYVALDIKPETPAHRVHDPTYPEIPPIRSAREAIPADVNRVLANLAEVDFAGISESMRSTIDRADRLLASPDLARSLARLDQITKHVDQLVLHVDRTTRDLAPELEGAAAQARKAIGPDGQIARQLTRTLHEIEVAARSLRRLSDQLGRDPGAIVRGGSQ